MRRVGCFGKQNSGRFVSTVSDIPILDRVLINNL